MNKKGNNWGVFGKKNTGKTWESLRVAASFYYRERNPKKLLILDHTNNSSYAGFPSVDLNRLEYRLDMEFIGKVQVYSKAEIDRFCQLVVENVRNTVVMFDDCGVLFRGVLSGAKERLLKSPKNNGNEYIFQTHSIRETAPALLEQIDVFVLKQTRDNYDDLPGKLPARREIGHLIGEVAEENRGNEDGKKWATRIYDAEADTLLVLDPETLTLFTQPAEAYFPWR